MTLATVAEGRRVRVLKVNGSGAIKQRLLDMGIRKGVVLKVERYAPLKDPIQISLQDYSLALRVEEAKNIIIEVLS